MLNIPVKCQLS